MSTTIHTHQPHHQHEHHNQECASCGTIYKGKFCYSCGEKEFHPSDLSMKKFLSQTVDIFTHFDSKFIRSLKYLMAYPGYLVKAYVTGNRVKYAKPMQVFLLCNIVFYFITHFIGVTDYSPNLGDHHYGGFSNFWILRWAESFDLYIIHAIDHLKTWKQQKLGLSDDDFYTTFFQNSWIYSKSFILLLIPVFALVFWAFFSKRFKYFGAAFVFAIYFVSFQMLAYCITSIFVGALRIDIFQPVDWLFFKTPVVYLSHLLFTGMFEAENVVIWLPYIYFAIQRVAKGNIWSTLAFSFLIAKMLNFITFVLYKKLIIVLTLLLMHHI